MVLQVVSWTQLSFYGLFCQISRALQLRQYYRLSGHMLFRSSIAQQNYSSAMDVVTEQHVIFSYEPIFNTHSQCACQQCQLSTCLVHIAASVTVHLLITVSPRSLLLQPSQDSPVVAAQLGSAVCVLFVCCRFCCYGFCAFRRQVRQNGLLYWCSMQAV